jgi:hypothetical protein
MVDAEPEDLSNIKPAEISHSANLYKTKVFGIQKTDQETEINESFGFRVKIELEPHELFKRDRGYENIQFFIEVDLYSQKCKFCALSYGEVMQEFYKGRMKKSQSMTLALRDAVKGQ